MAVYIEVVIFNNLAMDLLLVYATLMARRRKVGRVRILTAAVIGAGVATAYAVLPAVTQIVIRALLAPVMAIVFDKYRNFKDYLVSLGIFVLFTFSVGGAVSGIGTLIGVDIAGYPVLGLVAACAVILLASLRALVKRRSASARRILTVSVGYRGKSVSFKALYDSGNTLTDEVSGLPVVLLSADAIRQLSGLDSLNPCEYEGMIEAKTVCGGALLPLVALDGVNVGGKAYRALGALTDGRFDGFDVILNNTMWGNYDENKRIAVKNTESSGLRRTERGGLRFHGGQSACAVDARRGVGCADKTFKRR